jgi:hypothetical protein
VSFSPENILPERFVFEFCRYPIPEIVFLGPGIHHFPMFEPLFSIAEKPTRIVDINLSFEYNSAYDFSILMSIGMRSGFWILIMDNPKWVWGSPIKRHPPREKGTPLEENYIFLSRRV